VTERFARAHNKLSAALARVPRMGDSQDEVLRELAAHNYELSVPPGTLTVRCRAILLEVSSLEGALRVLANIIDSIDQSTPAAQFCQLVDEILPESNLTLAGKYDIIDLLVRSCRTERLASYYFEAVGRDPDPVLVDAEDLVSRLGQDLGDPEQLDPLIRVLEVIADDLGITAAARECRERADELAARIDVRAAPDGIQQPQTQHLRARRGSRAGAPAGSQAEIDTAYIILRIDPSDVRPQDQFDLSCLLYYEDRFIGKLYSGERLSLADVQSTSIQLINQALERAEQRRSSRFRPVVEFVLPREQINLAVESWHGKSSYLSLATQFAVVVRDLQRQHDASQRHASREKWHGAGQVLRSRGLAISRWISCSDEPQGPGELYLMLLAEPGLAVGLTFPPDCGPHHLPVHELLDSGMPVALWPHACDHAPGAEDSQASKSYAEFRDKLTTMTAERPMSDLPHIVHDLRRTVPELTRTGHGVALLWDDPARAVVPEQYRLAAPRRAGAAQ
jgi:hypothetical protein